MKKHISLLLTIITLTTYIFPLGVYAKPTIVETKLSSNEIVNEIKGGRKIDISKSIDWSNLESERFVIFVRANDIQKNRKNISQNGKITGIDNNVYGEAMAIPVDLSDMNRGEIRKYISSLNLNSDVIAITPVAKRDITSVPAFDDPLFPSSNTYTDDFAWYLSQPVGGNYGIDIKRAWEYLDGQGVQYGGDSEVVVAVIDTGAAYESHSKYADFAKMVDPVAWVFTKSTDFTDNLFVNSAETGSNQLDDDAKAITSYCMDSNSNGECDAGEMPNPIDDVNGFNVIDWGKYWGRSSLANIVTSEVCTNEPYVSDGVECVSTPTVASVCGEDALANYEYVGCWESDMGHPNDTWGHGTFVSNIITAKANNGTAGIGVAPGVTLLPIKIFGESYDDAPGRGGWVHEGGYADQIAIAVNYAVEMGADVINFSIAGADSDPYEQLAIDHAYFDDDIVVIASSGNSNTSATYYPAGYSSVLSVGASNKDGSRASYSNYGSSLEMVAPVGNGILSVGMYDTGGGKDLVKDCTWDATKDCIDGDPTASPSIFDKYAILSAAGTSFAAPQAVGVAALLKSAYPNLSAYEIRYLLKMSGLPSGSLTKSTTVGHGVLNAYNAIRVVDYRGVSLEKISRIFQGIIGSDGYPYTRFSDNGGITWSGWIKSGSVKTAGNITYVTDPTISGRVIMVMKGADSGVYTRYADEFGYASLSDSAWSSWVRAAYTSKSISTIVAGSNIVQTWVGTNSQVYSRYTSDGGVTWSAPTTASTKFLGNIASVYESNSGKVVQAGRASNSYVYTRTSSDQGATWSAWAYNNDYAVSDPQLFISGNNIVRLVRSTSNVLIIRYSNNGGVSWAGRTRASGNSGIAKSSVSYAVSSENGKTVISYIGGDSKIYSRYSADNGATWVSPYLGTVFAAGVYPVSTPLTVNAKGSTIQMVRANNSYIYYRKSSNGGVTWATWRNSGSIKTYGNMSLWYDANLERVFISARGLDNYVYTRSSDNLGSSYGTWVKSGYTTSSIYTKVDTIIDMDLSRPPL